MATPCTTGIPIQYSHARKEMQGRSAIIENDFFIALERANQSKFEGIKLEERTENGEVAPLLRRTIATYMAAKALIGVLTPEYDELQRVVVTPNNEASGYVYFIPQDSTLEMSIMTKTSLEASLAVRRCPRLHVQFAHSLGVPQLGVTT